MKTNHLIVILLLALITACIHQKERDERIKTFAAYLGAKKTKALDYTVKVFDQFIVLNFPEVTKEQAYLRFLKSMANDPFAKKKWLATGLDIEGMMHKMEASGMREEIRLFPDTLYLEPLGQKPKYRREFKYKYSYKGQHVSSNIPKYSRDTLKIIPPKGMPRYGNPAHSISADSAKRREKRIGELNTFGMYIEALEKVKTSDPFIREFLVNNQYAGDSPAPSIAGGLQQYCHEMDGSLNDYFIKRLMTIELFYDPILIQVLQLRR
jgi:hypothetical protein